MKMFSKTLVSAAALSLAVLPVAAQAGTRAGDSGTSFAAATSAPGLGRDTKGEKVDGTGIVIGLLALGAVAAGIIIAATSGQDQSPGT